VDAPSSTTDQWLDLPLRTTSQSTSTSPIASDRALEVGMFSISRFSFQTENA